MTRKEPLWETLGLAYDSRAAGIVAIAENEAAMRPGEPVLSGDAVLHLIEVLRAEASRPPVSGDALREALDRWYDQEHPGLDENEWRDGLAAYLSDVIALAATPPERSGLDVDTLRAVDRWIHTTPGVAFTPEAHANLYSFYRSHGYDPTARLSSGGEDTHDS